MKKALLAFAIVAMIAGRASATIVMADNFDSYADTAAFNVNWPATTGTGGTVATASPAPVTAPNSIAYSGVAGAGNRRSFTETGVPSATNTIRFSFDFYDTNAGASPYRQQHNIQDTTAPSGSLQLVSMGLNNNQTSANSGGNYYMARVLSYNVDGPDVDTLPDPDPDGGPTESVAGAGAYFKLNDFAGSVLRSTGWHNLRVEITPTTLSFYVDNILSERVATTGLTLRSYDNVRIGSALTSTTASNIDNVLVEIFDPTPAVPEAGSIAAMSMVGLISAAAVWIRKRRAGETA